VHLSARNRNNVVSVQGGPLLSSFERPNGGGGVAWSPDGRAIDYGLTRGGVSDIWRQPIFCSEPKQLTHFPPGIIYSFAWAEGGKTLVVAGGPRSADIVLLKSKKPH
jgi:Tol biopolymer transport system component